jgi:hypothetical protein
MALVEKPSKSVAASRRAAVRRSSLAFLASAFAPIRRFNSAAQEIGLPVTGLVAVFFLGTRVSWTVAAFVGLSVLCLLFLIAGIRREYPYRSINIEFSPSGEIEWLAAGGVLWRLSVKVRNHAGARTFVAHCAGEVDGLKPGSESGDFAFPWEGRAGEELLLRHDRPEYITIGYLINESAAIRFALPATTYSGPNNQSMSPVKQIGPSGRVELALQLTSADDKGYTSAWVTIDAPVNSRPSMKVEPR